MFQNYLKTALRHLVKNRLYSFINIFGLAVGLASCILIMLFVWDELSYDKMWSKASDIYRFQVVFLTSRQRRSLRGNVSGAGEARTPQRHS